MKLTVGATAPAFELPSTMGKPISLRSLRGRKVFLYFYPKDDTPGCTQEACDLRDRFDRLEDEDVTVLGVSKDSLASHERFRDKHDLPFTLLSDVDNAVAKAYGAYGQKMMYGKPVTGTIRSSFLIDEQGKIAAIWSPVKVPGHVDAVLAALAGETTPAPAKTASLRKALAAGSTRSSARSKDAPPAAGKARRAVGKARRAAPKKRKK